jgi:hypothetical protein
VVLVSYAHTEEVSFLSMDTPGTRRVFALVRLSVYGDTFMVESTKTVPYQTVSGPLDSAPTSLILRQRLPQVVHRRILEYSS